MNILTIKIKCWVLLVSITMFLTGCSILSDHTATPSLQKVNQGDRWLNNELRWKNWDIGDPNNQLVNWSYQDNALVIKLLANKDLNSFAQRQHTLTVKVIQLSDVSGLKTLLQTVDGIRTVLSAPTEMIPNAVYSESYIIAPKQTRTLINARQQDAKFIAVVCGFAELNLAKSFKLLTVPVISEAQKVPVQEKSWVDILTFGIFADEPEKLPDIIRPALVTVDITLGETSIEKFVATAQ